MTEQARRGVRVEADALTRRFGDHLALDGVSLAIAPGEAFGLLGPNGAGKTTFIRCLTGTLLPSGGEARVDGLSPAREPGAVRARLGFVAETSRLYPELRVQEYLRFRARLKGLERREIRSACDLAIERCGLQAMRRRLIGALSRGFRLRTGLADNSVNTCLS